MPTPYTLRVSGTLGEINVGARLAILGLIPLLAQIDAFLNAQFGMGALQLDYAVQLQAALNVHVEITDPTALLTGAIKAAAAALVQLEAALAAGLVPPSIAIGASANLSLIAALQAKIGAINLLLDLALGVKLSALDLLAQVKGALSVGPAALYAGTGQGLSTALSAIAAHDYSDAGLAPGDTVDILVIVSKAPGFYAGASVLFDMPPA